MSLRDLARYFAEWREPVSTTYRGHTVFSSAPPVSGGATLAAQLNVLENFGTPKSPTEDAATAHASDRGVEARAAGAHRRSQPLARRHYCAISKDSARTRWTCLFSPARAAQSRDIDARRCTSALTDSGGTRSEQREESPDEAHRRV